MEVRAWLGAGWWALILPGAGVVQVQPAGAVQGFFRGAGVQTGRQDGVLVAVAAGEVDGKAPPAGRPAVAEPAQRESLLVGELAVDIGERTAEAEVDGGQGGPAGLLAFTQPLAQRDLGRFGDGRWHAVIFADPARLVVAVSCRVAVGSVRLEATKGARCSGRR